MNQYADVYMSTGCHDTSNNVTSNLEKQKNLERDLKNLFANNNTSSDHNSEQPPSSAHNSDLPSSYQPSTRKSKRVDDDSDIINEWLRQLDKIKLHAKVPWHTY